MFQFWKTNKQTKVPRQAFNFTCIKLLMFRWEKGASPGKLWQESKFLLFSILEHVSIIYMLKMTFYREFFF